MSEENVEVVRRMYDAYLVGDIDKALQHFHPEAVIDFSIRGDVEAQSGHDRIVAVVTEWTSSWDDYSERVDEIRDLGDQVMVVATQTGRGKGSGVELTNQWAYLVDVEDGLITRFTGYANPGDALAASGASG